MDVEQFGGSVSLSGNAASMPCSSAGCAMIDHNSHSSGGPPASENVEHGRASSPDAAGSSKTAYQEALDCILELAHTKVLHLTPGDNIVKKAQIDAEAIIRKLSNDKREIIKIISLDKGQTAVRDLLASALLIPAHSSHTKTVLAAKGNAQASEHLGHQLLLPIGVIAVRQLLGSGSAASE